MENASKALLMAAGILIGIVILSLAVYLYASFSSATGDMQRQMEEDQINNFNNQFLVYEGKKDLTIYDVYTVANLAEENNVKYGLESSEPGNYYVTVNIENKKTHIEKNKLNCEDFINKYMTRTGYLNGNQVVELCRFECSKVNISDLTQRVNEVTFKQIN